MTGFVVQGHKLRLKPFHCVFIPCVCSCRESSVLTSASLWGCWWLLEWVRLSDCGTAMWPPAQLRFCAVTRPLWWMWLFTTHWARSSATPRMLLVFLIPDVRVQTERELYKQTELYKRSCGPVSRKSQEEGIRINTKMFERSAVLEKFLRSLHLFLKKQKIQALALSDCIEESLIENHNKCAQNY